jgi:uncharacterized membrane protein YfcA
MDPFLKKLLQVIGVTSALAALPLFAAFVDLQPPWPPAIAYVSAALVLLAALAAWEWNKSGVVRRRRLWLIVAAALTVGGLFGYLLLYSLFVETIPGSATRVIRGYSCTQQAREVYAELCPDLPRSALRDAEWEAVELWTRSSITAVRLGLTAAWLLFTAGLICAVAAVITGDRPKRKGGPRRPPPN